jgi:hypothetical protein
VNHTRCLVLRKVIVTIDPWHCHLVVGFSKLSSWDLNASLGKVKRVTSCAAVSRFCLYVVVVLLEQVLGLVMSAVIDLACIVDYLPTHVLALASLVLLALVKIGLAV